MDKLSVRVLKQIHKNGDSLLESSIYKKYGDPALPTLRFLKDEKYIRIEKCDRVSYNRGNSRDPNYFKENLYALEPKGKDYLQHEFWDDFDHWITRISAIVGAITGIASLIMHFIRP